MVNKIPSNLEECFEHLDQIFKPENKEAVLHNDGFLDIGLGRSLRNLWGLWEDSPLKDWFNERNIWHPDDMSGIILTSYKRYLINQPIELEKQLKCCQNYWINSGVDIKEEMLKSQSS
ncbi:MAG: GTP cyclohydrolase [Crenarchaeota archaeon]|nr:MAG: GTP cyclohydrolase [Thermoproteota archaeon]